jgi:hypothetical protein
MVRVCLDVNDKSATPVMMEGRLPCHSFNRGKDTWEDGEVAILVELHNELPRIFLIGVGDVGFAAHIYPEQFYYWAKMVQLFGPKPVGTWLEVPAWGTTSLGDVARQNVRVQKSPFDNVWLLESLLQGGRIQLSEEEKEIWYKDLTLTVNLCDEVASYVENRRIAERSDLLTGISNILVVSML